ncbi:hypothetical protein M8818_000665 [Zalaria obscura]|uniref:Uncharacterized protein n=1 Tax=Zalaria obscura TaxID=2024903 RepID=A0ACC3SN30_9PEZI
MPRKQVYGKKSRAYTYAATFPSPAKPAAQPQVYEDDDIIEKLEGLKLEHTSANVQVVTENGGRGVLEERDSNATLKLGPHPKDERRSRKQKTEPKEDVKVLESSKLKSTQVDSVVEEDPENVQPEADIPKSAEAIKQKAKPRALRPAPASAVPVSNIFTAHTSELLSQSSRPLTSFSDWSDQLSSHFSVAKIAEASFGEVYRLSLLRSHPSLSATEESVLKIIPLKPPPAALPKRMTKAAKEKIAAMSAPEDVAGEVRLMQRMTCIPGYTNFRDVCVLQGRPGSAFVEAWHSWNTEREQKGKETSYFADPALKKSYSDDQLWAVIEMQDAGTDLENTKVDSVWMLWDIFWGVVLALGKGEEGARFEHRDLHLENICIARPGIKGCVGKWDENGLDHTRRLGFTGIETTLIDYTISRAEVGNDGLTIEREDQQADVVYLDLEKDQSLFEGDGEEEYQYDIYRYMRSAMYLDDPLADLDERWEEAEESGRTWQGYHPQTNLVWLHFILYMLAEQVSWPSDEAGTVDGEKSRHDRAMELEEALSEVQALLDPEQFPGCSLKSAGDLVAHALDKGWLALEDVLGKKVASKSKKASQAKDKARKATRSVRTRP